MRKHPILVFLVVMTAGVHLTAGAFAADQSQAAALFQITVNSVDKGTARVMLRHGDVLIAVDSLKAAGLQPPPGVPEIIDGTAYVPITGLGPKIHVDYDEANLALTVTADPHLLAATVIDLANGAPPNLEYVDSRSAFVNYAFSSQNGHTPEFISEQGARIAGAFFDNSFSINPDGQFVRASTSLTFDNRANSTRLILGDSLTDGGALGGVARIGGINYATDFALNPYFTPFPNQRFAGVVSTPSIADIYVNGRQVTTVDVPPGVFNLENLPAVAGAGNIRVVLRNAFGQTQELGTPYYMGTQLLRRGLSDFSYSAGFERDTLLTGLGAYDSAAVSAHDRYGLTDGLTIGGFFNADHDKASGGPEVTIGMPIGTLGLFAAASRSQGKTDGSASAQYSYQSSRFSVGAAYTYTGPQYATLGLERADDRATTRVDSFVGVPLGPIADLSLDVSHAWYRDVGLNDRIALTAQTRIGNRFNFAVTLSHSQTSGQPVDNGIFAALTVSLGSRTTATASVDKERTGTTGAVQIQRSLPYGEGWGYLLQGAAGAQATNVADVQYQGRYGLYEVDATHSAGQTQTTVSVSGALVAIGGRILPTRPIQDAFALVRVPDVPDVTATLSHQDVGKTDSQGDVLIPNLLSYYGNELGINDQDIPLDYSVTQTDRTIAPGYRGGALVIFPVKKLQAYVGTLEVIANSNPIVPAYGTLTVTAGTVSIESPIGANGEFYLDSLPGPAAAAEIHYEGGACTFTLNAPASREHFVQLGKLTCTQAP